MKRHPALVPLSRFHRSALFVAQMAKLDGPQFEGYPRDVEGKARYALDFYDHDLKKHFELEETKLLPAIRGFDTELDQLADDVVEEHKQLRALFEALPEAEDAVEKLDALGRALEKHIRSQERVLFEKIQEVLPEENLTGLQGLGEAAS